jgi:hypothetical protein
LNDRRSNLFAWCLGAAAWLDDLASGDRTDLARFLPT